MTVSSEQKVQITKPLHRVLRCLYNAEGKLSFKQIGQLTQLSEPEVRSAVEMLQQNERAEVDPSGYVWLISAGPEPDSRVSPIVRSGQIAASAEGGDDETANPPYPFRAPPTGYELLQGVLFGLQRTESADENRWYDGTPLPFREPPQPPRGKISAFDESVLDHWRAELVALPEDAVELARIQRSVISTLRSLDTPAEVLRSLERIARLLDHSDNNKNKKSR